MLAYLSATQATRVDPGADAQPGKILHETRNGEMARLGEVPFRLYYGTVDATPLFVMLAGMYFERTGDLETIKAIWPNVKAALRWIDEYGDADGDGFVEYARAAENGLANQGWKDSYDSIFHADGALAEGPIALCEVQGYVFAAKTHAARIAAHLGERDFAAKLETQAQTLQQKFRRGVLVRGSRRLCAGARRATRSRAACAARIRAMRYLPASPRPSGRTRVAQTLMARASFSGWGIRTVASGEARYNPISYHNGSIWPHDNAMIALGFARYGLAGAAAQLFSAMFAAAVHQDLRRLPELFCGFTRRPHRGPTAYPVACAPQAWAAAAPFAFLHACLGMELRHRDNSIRFVDPIMPAFSRMGRHHPASPRRIAGEAEADRHGDDVSLNLLDRSGDAKVMLVK